MNNYKKNHYKKRTFIPIENIPKLKGERLLSANEVKKTTIKDNSKNNKNLNIKNDHQISANFKFYASNINCQQMSKKFICISVKEDCSQNIVIQKYLKDLEIVFLEYDFIGEKWDFFYYKNFLIFIVNNEHILPLGIYNRSFVPPMEDRRHSYCLNFNFALQVWGGYKINCSMENYYNFSKPLQIHLMNKVINKDNMNIISIPKTFMIKAKQNAIKKFLADKKLIVKSCSGVRSKVEVDHNFRNWDFKYTNNLPILFQECIVGNDIRVHTIKSKTYAVQIKNKDGIDYRYNKNSGYEIIELPEQIKEFCHLLKDFEKLYLVGIDLVFNSELKIYYVLETNPNPGWAGFHRATNQEASLARDIIHV